MSTRRFNICLPHELLLALDEAAQAEFVSRSAYIREAISLRIRLNHYLASEVADSQSHFNIIKAAHSRRMSGYIRRSPTGKP